jgi:hypothetical protein
MDTTSSRFISVTLTESEWRALRAIEPNPTAWIKEQITQRLADPGARAGVPDGADGKPRTADLR